ncbi:hypothetical protein HYPSUDRAFT_39829 [Hypholoma sublateritium FD-334 SS-4]|uniref:RRM Nup35-type domain-containing protein n=1 Tax=Hypholoma sublateritium (strain FD-334 SS-4) TaxID=945553 RepID=A0A0D2MIZ4_HYPSF|nr:hypothetical protein HYPSUDRAFT_39829 [Hypholoma sublateritium FD-334 SS-4]
MQHSPFTVAGMSSSTSSHNSPNLNSWGSSSTGGPLAQSFGDSLSQSRSHYQSGYLMSTAQNNNAAQGKQRVDEAPVVQTKAKMNQILSRGASTDFGMDSMFQSSRQRQTLADEDAPPTSSINDIPNEINLEPSPARFQPRKSTLDQSQSPFSSSRRGVAPTSPPSTQVKQPVYIIVFGYPADRYSVTVEFFKSLGSSTDPEPNPDIINCFKIGYYEGGDAMRAVRKNGDIIAGSWMVGAKLADPSQLDAFQPSARFPFAQSTTQNQSTEASNTASNAMAVDEPYAPFHSGTNTPAVGTPIRLAPSMSAFRKTPGIPASASKPATPQQSAWSGGLLATSASAPAQPSPNKGVIGQVSDLIFGW